MQMGLFQGIGIATLLAAFDEDWYLSKYPDVAAAISEKKLPSGRVHFERHGLQEGRQALDFQADWYARSYPLADEEMKAGQASSMLEHYVRFGRARGYLPNPRAKRPRGASAAEGKFGGLWIDAGNAADLVRGRTETGAITAAEAGRLSFFMENGYVILPGAVRSPVLQAARTAIEEAYSGKFPGLKFECRAVSETDGPWCAAMNDVPAKAIDPHMFFPALRDAMFAPPIIRFLGILFDAIPLASQTLGFLRGSAQEAHQDSAYVAYTIPRNFAATWIALEDVTPNAGELMYYVGSHRFPDFLYGDSYKSVSEARRMGTNPERLTRDVREHVKTLPIRADGIGLKHERFLARAGDVLVWHADLAHGGSPVSDRATRKSLVTHYCPRYLAPLFMEASTVTLHHHRSGGHFVSGAYPSMAPVD